MPDPFDASEMTGEGLRPRDVAAESSLRDLWRMIARATPKSLRPESLDRTLEEWGIVAVDALGDAGEGGTR